MTLDEQINKDLTELYHGKELSGAKSLASLIEVSTKGLPQHFVGDRDAKTVFVMLNPGSNTEGAEKELAKRKKTYDCTSAEAFIESYIRELRDFGKIHRVDNPVDKFDVKQAAFLKPWKDNGIILPDAFPQNKETFADAKEAVLMQKLQLELLPYCSAKFEPNSKNIALLVPFVEILLDEIFRKERNYVIFGGRVFDDAFATYNKAKGSNIIDMSAEKVSTKLPGRASSVSCRPVTLNWNGKTQKALIACTFPERTLADMPDVMQAYGAFCYEQFSK